MKKHSKNHLSTSTIWSLLLPNFPSSLYITKHDIYYTRVCCSRLLKTFDACYEYQQFEQNLKSDSIFLKEVEKDLQLEIDYAF